MKLLFLVITLFSINAFSKTIIIDEITQNITKKITVNSLERSDSFFRVTCTTSTDGEFYSYLEVLFKDSDGRITDNKTINFDKEDCTTLQKYKEIFTDSEEAGKNMNVDVQYNVISNKLVSFRIYK